MSARIPRSARYILERTDVSSQRVQVSAENSGNYYSGSNFHFQLPSDGIYNMESAYISYTLNVNQHASATGNVLGLSKGAESAFETMEWNVGGSVERINKYNSYVNSLKPFAEGSDALTTSGSIMSASGTVFDNGMRSSRASGDVLITSPTLSAGAVSTKRVAQFFCGLPASRLLLPLHLCGKIRLSITVADQNKIAYRVRAGSWADSTGIDTADSNLEELDASSLYISDPQLVLTRVDLGETFRALLSKVANSPTGLRIPYPSLATFSSVANSGSTMNVVYASSVGVNSINYVSGKTNRSLAGGKYNNNNETGDDFMCRVNGRNLSNFNWKADNTGCLEVMRSLNRAKPVMGEAISLKKTSDYVYYHFVMSWNTDYEGDDNHTALSGLRDDNNAGLTIEVVPNSGSTADVEKDIYLSVQKLLTIGSNRATAIVQ